MSYEDKLFFTYQILPNSYTFAFLKDFVDALMSIQIKPYICLKIPKMISIQQQKKLLRAEIRQRKAEISFEDKKALSDNIWSQLEELDEFKSAKCVMLYWSMADEVNTQEFIEKWASDKRIILPCVNDDLLELREYRGKEDLKPGDLYHIPEPSGPLFHEEKEIELIVVPGVAFDMEGNRMGRGKAYYDKFLKRTNSFKVGVGFNIQILEDIPYDELDVKMDLVLTHK